MANEPNRSRIENLLLRILGENVDLEEPLSRIEDLLYQVADIIVTLDEHGLIPINEIPPAAIEHMVTVVDDTARYALTTDDVENGDTVYVNSTKIMYMVVDDTHLSSDAGYKEYSAGIATKAIADQLGNVIDTYYQRLIDNSNKLSSDLVDDTGATNLFTNSNEKQTWNGKQDAIDSNNKLSSDLVDDANSTNKFTNETEKQTWNGKQDTTLATWTPGSATTHQAPAVGDTITEALQKIDNNQRLDESNISSLQGHFTFSANSKMYYLQPEQPASPVDGDIWIG